MWLQLLSNKNLTILYFVINELFYNSLIMLLCIAKEALFEQIALNKILHTKVSSQLFYSLSIILFSPLNSLDKASGLPYILSMPFNVAHTIVYQLR